MTEIVDLPDLVRGDSRDIRVTITDENGAAIDITADLLTVTFKIDPTTVDPGEMQVKTTVPAGSPGTEGVGFLNIEASDTSGLVAGTSYEYDVQWVQKSVAPENVHTLTKGKVKVIEQITIDTT
jgi:hypothetical protein